MEIDSKDYHDFVFQGGRLVGEFEQMYQKSALAPWKQDEANKLWFSKVSVAVAGRALEDRSVRTVHDIGSGLGYFISSFRRKGLRLSGSDISATAVSKARELFHDILFEVDDIRKDAVRPTYDLVLARALFFCVFPDMPTVVRNIAAMVRKDDYLFVGLLFPALHTDFVGKEIIANPDQLIEWLSPFFEAVIDVRIRRFEFPGEGPLLNWLGRKR